MGSTAEDIGGPLLPEGTRLVHIGPHKTGTTALQGALDTARAALLARGVRYASRTRNPVTAILAVTERAHPSIGKPPSQSDWRALVRDVTGAREPRVVLSSEFFADAQPDAIRRIVTDLDPARVHIAVTLRPLAKIIPSQWQQYIQSGSRASFDTWLDAMFNKPTTKLTPTFWHRHRHDRLIERWAEVVGQDKVTVVVLDDRDHAMVLRAFERLLGLTDGTLVAEPDFTNRSMTLPEIEVVRAFNTVFRAEGLGTPLHAKVMRYGASAYMKTRTPEPDEPRIEIPPWAVERIAAVAREMVDAIVASGVRIIGDPEGLTAVPATLETTATPETTQTPQPTATPATSITPEIAASAAMGVLLASGLARGGSARIPLDADAPDDLAPDPHAYVEVPSIEPLSVVRVPTIQLLGIVLRRAREDARRRINGVVRRARPRRPG
jgi:hypothetical protein